MSTAPPDTPLRITLAFGTRPEAIKMAPLVLALRADPAHFQTRVVVTAQHRQMLDQVLTLFNLTPDVDLDLMQPGQSLSGLSQRVLAGMEPLLHDARPDLLLVHGDTTTSAMAALSAFYQRVPVGHVEAGLRTWDTAAPWPEELNRQLTGRIAQLHFAPTERARQNLLREGVDDASVCVTGNTVIDALRWVAARLASMQAAGGLDLASLLAQNTNQQAVEARSLRALAQVAEGRGRLVLITGHRRENFGHGFERICQAIQQLASQQPAVHFVYPVHLNPAVLAPVHQRLAGLPNIHLLPPLDYLPFVYLMTLASVILTDSGGIQEEAPGLGKPVLVMREQTERPEAIEAGTVTLVGTDVRRIVEGVEGWLRAPPGAGLQLANPYGDGHACARILTRLRAYGADGR